LPIHVLKARYDLGGASVVAAAERRHRRTLRWLWSLSTPTLSSFCWRRWLPASLRL